MLHRDCGFGEMFKELLPKPDTVDVGQMYKGLNENKNSPCVKFYPQVNHSLNYKSLNCSFNIPFYIDIKKTRPLFEIIFPDNPVK